LHLRERIVERNIVRLVNAKLANEIQNTPTAIVIDSFLSIASEIQLLQKSNYPIILISCWSLSYHGRVATPSGVPSIDVPTSTLITLVSQFDHH
jgi:hypothetical protein